MKKKWKTIEKITFHKNSKIRWDFEIEQERRNENIAGHTSGLLSRLNLMVQNRLVHNDWFDMIACTN